MPDEWLACELKIMTLEGILPLSSELNQVWFKKSTYKEHAITNVPVNLASKPQEG